MNVIKKVVVKKQEKLTQHVYYIDYFRDLNLQDDDQKPQTVNVMFLCLVAYVK